MTKVIATLPDVTFVPLYQRVAEDIRQAIRDGRLRPGEKLPPRSELKKQYQVSGTVIDTAMLVLKTEGWVRGHQGMGTFVANHPPIT